MKLTVQLRQIIINHIEALRIKAADKHAEAESDEREARALIEQLDEDSGLNRPSTSKVKATEKGPGRVGRRGWSKAQREAASKRMKAAWKSGKFD